MRCRICDYCDDEAKSIYNFSVVEKKGKRRRYVYYDKTHMEEICNYCADGDNQR